MAIKHVHNARVLREFDTSEKRKPYILSRVLGLKRYTFEVSNLYIYMNLRLSPWFRLPPI